MSLLKNCVSLFIFLSIQLNTFGFAFENKIFKKNIHTVILTNEESQTTFPLLNLNDGKQLTLRFDDIANEVKDYSYTLIHCDDGWNQSDLFPNDYLDGFEEEQITLYYYSVNTSVDYIHYSISFPNSNIKPNKSGNYILLVFDNFDRADIVLTQKFFISETKVEITPQPTIPLDFNYRYTHHEIDFEVNYSIFPIDDPANDVHVVILQNNRYDNALYDLKPKFVKDKELIYNFDDEIVFEGGNEYRVFDSRDLINGGQGIEDIVYIDSVYHTVLTVDHKRAFQKYSTKFDHNGNYYIGARINKSPYIEADYSHVHFRLPYPKELATGTVYINGGLTGNELQLDARMLYRDSLKRYEASILLKQGVFDYTYLFKEGSTQKGKWETLEGNHYQTENIYTILVYHQGFSDNAQKLIGVKRFIYQ
jgi:hypothetical protein